MLLFRIVRYCCCCCYYCCLQFFLVRSLGVLRARASCFCLSMVLLLLLMLLKQRVCSEFVGTCHVASALVLFFRLTGCLLAMQMRDTNRYNNIWCFNNKASITNGLKSYYKNKNNGFDQIKLSLSRSRSSTLHMRRIHFCIRATPDTLMIQYKSRRMLGQMQLQSENNDK